MAFKVVGIVGSPRKGRNTDMFVSKILEGASSTGAEVDKIYLNDLDIKPCQACDKSPAPAYCFYEDGMKTVYRALETADALVVGTPAYYDSISAQLKLVIDRSNCLTEMIKLSNGKVMFKPRLGKRKKGIFVWIADFSGNPEHALASVRLWFKDANIELANALIITGSERMSVESREELLQRAFKKGVSLAESLKSS
jgi:multimeric flavodoxin WrbA